MRSSGLYGESAVRRLAVFVASLAMVALISCGTPPGAPPADAGPAEDADEIDVQDGDTVDVRDAEPADAAPEPAADADAGADADADAADADDPDDATPLPDVLDADADDPPHDADGSDIAPTDADNDVAPVACSHSRDCASIAAPPCRVSGCVDGQCAFVPNAAADGMLCRELNGCTRGTCGEGVCVTEPVPDGTQTEYCDRLLEECRSNARCESNRCVVDDAPDETRTDDGLVCIGGRALPVENCEGRGDGVSCGEVLTCNDQVCQDGLCVTLPVRDGVACTVTEGGVALDSACRAGVCAWPPTCGNGEIDDAEGCDDGNFIDGDGCDARCTLELGWTCDVPGEACISRCAGAADDTWCDRRDCIDYVCTEGACAVPAAGAIACEARATACTAASCVDEVCVIEPLPDGPHSSCSASSPCQTASCRSGACVVDDLPDGPSNGCPHEACEAARCEDGACATTPVVGPSEDCPDVSPCAVGICGPDGCETAVLEDGPNEACPAPGACEIGWCEAGACAVMNRPDGPAAGCESDIPCAEAECVAGACQTTPVADGETVACSEVAGPCRAGLCVDGTCRFEPLTDETAAPGGVCVGGRVQPRTACVGRADGGVCTHADSCVDGVCEDGACVVTPRARGVACVIDERYAGTCDDEGRCSIAPECGNGRREFGEECDLGDANGRLCLDDCTIDLCVTCGLDGTACDRCDNQERTCSHRANACSPVFWDDYACACGFSEPPEAACRDDLACGSVVCDGDDCVYEPGPDGQACAFDACTAGVCMAGDCIPAGPANDGMACDDVTDNACRVSVCDAGACAEALLPDETACVLDNGDAGTCRAGHCRPSASCTGRVDGTACGEGPCGGVCVAGRCTSPDAMRCDLGDGTLSGQCIAGRYYPTPAEPCEGGYVVDGVCARRQRVVPVGVRDWELVWGEVDADFASTEASCSTVAGSDVWIDFVEGTPMLPFSPFYFTASASFSEYAYEYNWYEPEVRECYFHWAHAIASAELVIGSTRHDLTETTRWFTATSGQTITLWADAACEAYDLGEASAEGSSEARIGDAYECPPATCRTQVVIDGACEPVRASATRAECEDGCRDLATDRDNCGACGVRCLAQEECVDGECTCAPDILERAPHLCDGCPAGTAGRWCLPQAECATDVDGTECGSDGRCVRVSRSSRNYASCVCSSPTRLQGLLCEDWICNAPRDEVRSGLGDYRCAEEELF